VKTNDLCTPLEVPRNAYLSSSGTSWYCDRGYRKAPNAYLDYSGSDWRCESGFRKQGAAGIAENIR
jgi:hypothetical protein